MAKRVVTRPDWLKSQRVADIFSVSGCISEDFADYVKYWKHNGWWLFDSPQTILELAFAQSIDLADTTLFFYEVYDLQFWDGSSRWEPIQPEASFKTAVIVPDKKTLHGYDVVNFCALTSPECSPLSCNGVADDIATNEHCLLPSLEIAKELVEAGKFDDTEPGPFRIFAVYSAEWPTRSASGTKIRVSRSS